jgi:hypothetical protein
MNSMKYDKHEALYKMSRNEADSNRDPFCGDAVGASRGFATDPAAPS